MIRALRELPCGLAFLRRISQKSLPPRVLPMLRNKNLGAIFVISGAERPRMSIKIQVHDVDLPKGFVSNDEEYQELWPDEEEAVTA